VLDTLRQAGGKVGVDRAFSAARQRGRSRRRPALDGPLVRRRDVGELRHRERPACGGDEAQDAPAFRRPQAETGDHEVLEAAGQGRPGQLASCGQHLLGHERDAAAAVGDKHECGAGWTLALAHAAQARRWRWFALLVVAGYLAYTISFLFALQPATICSFNPDSGDFSACSQPNIPLVLMFTLGKAIGPVAILIYALRAPGRRQRQLPEGLVVSSLHDAKQPGDNATPAAGG